MKKKIFALRLGGGEMVLNGKQAKGAVLLAALLVGMVMLAIPALAACPAGTIDLSNPNSYVSEAGAAAPIDNTVAPAVLQQAGTYCIPLGGITLGGAAPQLVDAFAASLPGGASYPDELQVGADNVTIMGEGCCARLTGSGASNNPLNWAIIEIPAGRSGIVIHNLIIQDGGDGVAIDSNGNADTIEAITFDGVTGVVFTPAAVLLSGQDPIVQHNLFDMDVAGNLACIRLLAGTGAQILNNVVEGLLAAAGNPTFFVENQVAAYNAAVIDNNRVQGGVGQLVAPTGLGNSFNNSAIRNNIASTADHGIDLGGASNNMIVSNNEIVYGDNVAGANGIWDAGGSNIEYRNNILFASSAVASVADDGIEFLSNNAIIDGNHIDARGLAGAATGDGIDATGDFAAGASNAQITNNQIVGTGDGDPAIVAGFGIPASGYGILMNWPANTNFTVTGNTISNTAAGGIIATAGLFPPAGGGNHTISNNTLTNIGTGLTQGFAGNWPAGTGIATNGNSTIANNVITGVRAGVGIGLTGSNDQVTGNTVRSLSDDLGVGIGVWVTGGNTFIDNNTIENLSGIEGDGIAILTNNCTVTNNTIDGVFSGHGIHLYDSETLFVAGGTTVANMTITGNTVKNVTNGAGIFLADNDNNIVSGNTIMETGEDGILLFAENGLDISAIIVGSPLGVLTGLAPTADNNTISNNTIIGAGRNALDVAAVGIVPSQRYAAIRLDGNCNNNVIDHNIVTDAGGPAYAVGIDLLGNIPDNNDVTNNTLSGFTTVTPGAGVSEGIRVLTGLNNTVIGNTVQNSGNLQVGIDVRTVDEVPILDNLVEGMLECGLKLMGGTVPNPYEVKGNTLSANVTAICMAGGAANITDKNKVSGGATALYVDSLASGTNFEVHGNCFDAAILVRNDTFGTLDASGNYWATTPGPTNVFGPVDTSGALASCPGEPTPPGSFCCTYPQGWNLISMPAVPTNPNAASIFDALPLYEYDACTGTYSTPTDVSSTEGYWLYLTFEQEFCIDGTVPLTDQTIVLPCAGWHLIGTCFDAHKLNTLVTHDAQTHSLADAGNWILPVVFSYDPVTHSYSAVSWLVPCLGYWVYTLVDNVTLTIPFAQPPMPTSVPLSTMELPQGLTPPPPPSLDGFFDQVEDGLVFTNVPNPVTDVHTTTFMVKGALSGLVEQIKVQVFDLTGRLIYEDQRTGTELTWHTDSSWGEYLANGIYLYRLSVLIDGQWIVSEVKKLAVMR